MSVYEDIKLEGHIIDSLLLPQVLDDILERGGEYRILRFKMGKEKDDPSLAVLRVTAAGRGRAGRDPARSAAARRRADRPERRPRRAGAGRRRLSRGLLLHHQPGDLHPLRRPMDPGGVAGDGLRHPGGSRSRHRPDHPPHPGEGRRPHRGGAARHPGDPARPRPGIAGVRVHGLGGLLGEAQAAGGRAGGPAHAREPGGRQADRRGAGTGHHPHGRRAGVRQAGDRRAGSTWCSAATPWPRTTSSRPSSTPRWASTSPMGESVEGGHEHHLRAINRIRRAGGIRQAVEQGVLTKGLFYEIVQQEHPLRAGRVHPRRRAAPRRDHRHHGGPAGACASTCAAPASA